MISITKSILILSLVSYVTAILNDHHTYGTLEYNEYDRPEPIDLDILDMIDKMTVEEKIGQMTQINQDLVLNADGRLNRTAVEYYAKNYYVGSYLNQLARYMTIFLNCTNTNYSMSFRNGDNYDSADYAKIIEEIQEITLSVNSTFKIPIIYGLDHIHGAHYVANSK